MVEEIRIMANNSLHKAVDELVLVIEDMGRKGKLSSWDTKYLSFRASLLKMSANSDELGRIADNFDSIARGLR